VSSRENSHLPPSSQLGGVHKHLTYDEGAGTERARTDLRKVYWHHRSPTSIAVRSSYTPWDEALSALMNHGPKFGDCECFNSYVFSAIPVSSYTKPVSGKINQ